MKKLTISLPIILPDIPDANDQCVSRLIDTIEGKEGVEEAHVKGGERSPELCIHFDPDTITLNELKKLAWQTGAKLNDNYGHLLLETEGIRHPRHARGISQQLNKLPGAVDAYASASGWVRIEFDQGETSTEILLNSIEDLGLAIKRHAKGFRDGRPGLTNGKPVEKYESHEESLNHQHKHDHSQLNTNHEHDHRNHGNGGHGHDHNHGGAFGEKTDLIFSLIGGGLLAVGFALSFVSSIPGWISLVLFCGSYFFGGFFLVQETYTEVKAGNFEIDFLMLVAAAGAAILGKWAEGSLLLFLFSLGHSMEHYAMGRAREAIKGLADLAPKTALKKTDGKTDEVPVEDLQVGDTIVVRPNSKISADGIIINGQSSVNQAPITGESVPVDKSEFTDMGAIKQDPKSIEDNHRVFAGTINGSSSLEIKVTKLSKDSTLSRLIKLVNEAETQKSPTQQFTDKFEKYFVPAVLGTVVLLNFAFLVIDESYAASFYRSMAVLVAASHRALAISTPSAVLSGISRAASGGVLIKGGRPLENLGILKALAFDKTGTLTEGEPKLTDVLLFNGTEETELMSTAVVVENLSDHPLAAAVVRDGKERLNGAELPEAEDLESITGRGVKATVNGSLVQIGNKELFEESDGKTLPNDLRQKVEDLEKEGKTTMIVRKENSYLGILGLMDTPREDAQSVVKRLRNLGLVHLIILTGDNQRVADAVAEAIGIDDPKGNLLPEDKVEAIKRLRNDENHVAMVGDGVNDAPAMANSTVGIAMVAAGSDVALETADVALMADKISVLPFAIGLSRKTKVIIKQNLWISLGMIAILVPATIFGLNIGPAVVGHEGSTIVVVFNALRLLGYKS
ncbi:MAG TPA: heavy metal translocating P-type ATPase [Balneolaceae bacterium]|nr:heavy metal translocating P-type ATPase [Balneolaceae bacterium]